MRATRWMVLFTLVGYGLFAGRASAASNEYLLKADTVEVDGSRVFKATGHPSVTGKDGTRFTAEHIMYDAETKRIRLRGGVTIHTAAGGTVSAEELILNVADARVMTLSTRGAVTPGPMVGPEPVSLEFRQMLPRTESRLLK